MEVFAFIVFLLSLAAVLGAFIVTWVVGARKGYPWAGFFLGLFLSWIGLIILLLLPPKAGVARSQTLRTGVKAVCPFCKELVQPDALVCPHCRRDVGPQGPVFSASSSMKCPLTGAPEGLFRFQKESGPSEGNTHLRLSSIIFVPHVPEP